MRRESHGDSVIQGINKCVGTKACLKTFLIISLK